MKSLFNDSRVHGNLNESILLTEQGIGKKLLSELINRAKISGYHNMIGVIDATNNGSIQFHENFGFTVVGNIKEVGYKFDRWLDAVIMSLIL